MMFKENYNDCKLNHLQGMSRRIKVYEKTQKSIFTKVKEKVNLSSYFFLIVLLCLGILVSIIGIVIGFAVVVLGNIIGVIPLIAGVVVMVIFGLMFADVK